MYESKLELKDFKAPYDVLTNILTIEQIIKLSNELKGIEVNFKKYDYESTSIFRRIENCLGYELAVSVYKCYIGDKIYFSNFKKSLQNKITELIKEEYDGYNIQLLAYKYGYCERHIRRKINKKNIDKYIMEGQLSFFDSNN